MQSYIKSYSPQGMGSVVKNEMALQNASILTGENQATGMAKDELW